MLNYLFSCKRHNIRMLIQEVSKFFSLWKRNRNFCKKVLRVRLKFPLVGGCHHHFVTCYPLPTCLHSQEGISFDLETLKLLHLHGCLQQVLTLTLVITFQVVTSIPQQLARLFKGRVILLTLYKGLKRQRWRMSFNLLSSYSHVPVEQAFFITPAAEKTKTQGKNSTAGRILPPV